MFRARGQTQTDRHRVRDVADCRTWSVGPDFAGVGAWSERCARLEFGVGKLRQVGHHAELVDARTAHLVGTYQLQPAKQPSH